jgi:hypothetical protein
VSIIVLYSPHNLPAYSAVHLTKLERNLVLMIINYKNMVLPKLQIILLAGSERRAILVLDNLMFFLPCNIVPV